jgi:hypothetical protein
MVLAFRLRSNGMWGKGAICKRQKPARGKAAAVVDGMGVKHRAPTTGHVEAGSIRTICPEHLIPNSFHILEQYLLTAAVIEFRGPAVGVAGDALSSFKGAVIF